MPVNPHFQNNFSTTSEQNLLNDLIIESIQIYGVDVLYVPREHVDLDSLYGEDPLSQFSNSYTIEMYTESVQGFGGEGELLSKFGIQLNNEMEMSVSKTRFEAIVPTAERTRPHEGDLLLFPLNNQIFEISFVDHDHIFYQTGIIHTYKLKLEQFVYSHETANTGNTEFDLMQREQSFSIEIDLDSGGTGDYTNLEPVYVGTDLSNTTFSGIVYEWSNTAYTLRVGDITGEIANGDVIVGDTSNAQWTVANTYNEDVFIEFNDDDDFADNFSIENNAFAIIDSTQNNVFGDFS